ncbi:uncharacterized protein LAJ45_06983 [Morchella importuna]|uniref:uncharacterized protein n=1 Tax=Morchella importuna TaxID=1174673 RepID=UPI001E8CEE95|nr:uncharacterized protein LAJ45_06983 [Morchella importuna]KAH8149008.1 hypothetical protein LAJ45_06983 [Morchella importuna]
MSSIINKRQQARNERILQDLLKSAPGNDRCADCGTQNPAWASWSLGIFLCIRCASLHRKLGTHISKVKSISMDSWTSDQIDNMRANGNAKSNLYYNPDPSKHPAPISNEDSVGVLERYIRNKYEYQLFRGGPSEQASSTSSNSSNASSSFGASVGGGGGLSLPSSSSSNASFQSQRPAPQQKQRSVSGGLTSRLGVFRSTSPSQKKVTQVLGATPYGDSAPPPVQFPHGMVQAPPAIKYEDQLKTLQEMGFKDDKQILQVLVLTDGNVAESVEHLTRLNNAKTPGLAPAAAAKKPGSPNPFEALDRELPPLPPGATEPSTPAIQQPQPQSAPPTSYGAGADSWFQAPVPVPAPIQMQATGWQQGQYQVSTHSTGPQQSPTNPYYSQNGNGTMYAAPQAVAGYNPFVTNSAPPTMNNPYQHQAPQQQQQMLIQQQQQFLQQQQFTQQQAALQQQQQQQQQQAALQAQQQQQLAAQQQAAHQLQLQQQQYLQSQLAPQAPLWASQPQPLSPQPNPYQSQLLQQRTGGVDKSAILALFNYPHLAPQPSANPVPLPLAENKPPPTAMERSMSAPSAGSNNPFLPQAQQQQVQQQQQVNGGQKGGMQGGHRSQESVDFGAWQSGRHSPDAFASLSFGQ